MEEESVLYLDYYDNEEDISGYTGKIIWHGISTLGIEMEIVMYYLNGKKHRDDGFAYIHNQVERYFYLENVFYFRTEDWFNALSQEQKEKALWNINEWRKEY